MFILEILNFISWQHKLSLHKQIGRNKLRYWTVTIAELYAISKQKIKKMVEHTQKIKAKVTCRW